MKMLSVESGVRRRSFMELVGPRKSELEKAGWVVDLSNEEIALFSFFNNGRPRKTPEIHLSYNPLVMEGWVDEDGPHEEWRPSLRPYCLRCRQQATRTFTSPSVAIVAFLRVALRTHRFEPGALTGGPIMTTNHWIRQPIYYKNEFKQSAGQLVGLVTGLIADRDLNDAEVRFLHEWITVHDEIAYE
jgi:hypothetical protein